MNKGARKFDDGKPPVVTGFMWRWPRAIKEVAKVSAVGAEKYDVVLPDNNCLNVPNGFNRYANAIGRHLLAMAIDGPMNTEKGGSLPPEGRGVYHLAQLIWNAMTVLERYLIDQEEAVATKKSWVDGMVDRADQYLLDQYFHAALTTPEPPSPSLHNPDRSAAGRGCTQPNLGFGHYERALKALSDNGDIFLVK